MSKLCKVLFENPNTAVSLLPGWTTAWCKHTRCIPRWQKENNSLNVIQCFTRSPNSLKQTSA
jgi:hypothetical protein